MIEQPDKFSEYPNIIEGSERVGFDAESSSEKHWQTADPLDKVAEFYAADLGPPHHVSDPMLSWSFDHKDERDYLIIRKLELIRKILSEDEVTPRTLISITVHTIPPKRGQVRREIDEIPAREGILAVLTEWFEFPLDKLFVLIINPYFWVIFAAAIAYHIFSR